MTEEIKKLFSDYFDTIIQKVPQLVAAFIVMSVFVGLGIAFAKILKMRMAGRYKGSIVPNVFGDIVKWGFWVAGLLISLHVLGFGALAGSLIAGAGISALVFGFAFKDIATNFLAGVILAINRPFKAGDLVEISGAKGKVQKMDLRALHLRTADGRDVYLPNSMIIANVFTNFTRDGLLRLDFPLGLDTEADVHAARAVVIKTLEKFERVLKAPTPDFIVEGIGESTLDVRVLFWIDQFKTAPASANPADQNLRSAVLREVRDALIAEGFTFPSKVLEHKMYRDSDRLNVRLESKSA